MPSSSLKSRRTSRRSATSNRASRPGQQIFQDTIELLHKGESVVVTRRVYAAPKK
jgi:hypothetical protein